LCVEEEFAQVLQVATRDGNIVSMIIRGAWDGARLAPMTKNSPIHATDAHISIIGHTTRDELLRHLTDTEQANGFANRFIWLYLERSKFIDNPTGVPNETLKPLIDELRDAVDFARKTTLMRRDDDAAAGWRAAYRELSEEKTGLVGSITARGEAQVMRLACIYALLDRSAVVRVEHLEAALALWEYSEKCARFIFGDSQGDPTVDRILTALKQGAMTETETAGLFNRHSYKEIDRALGFISNNEIAKPEIEETGGRPRTIWKLCSNAQ
jgi:DNA replicative helicase MCM subunit Mcm2 (Cdc46/Mcm family)